MKPLLTLEDADIFPSAERISDFSQGFQREAVKAIVLDDKGRIALVGKRYPLLPGGGVEIGESREEALAREMLEEIGCQIKINDYLGFTDEYRSKKENQKHQLTYCFAAQLVGEKGTPQTTEDDEQGMTILWLPLDEAISFLEKMRDTMPLESYNSHFNVRTHLAFLELFKQNLS